MFTDLYSPLSLVAENANTDSTISLIMKEESITDSILKVESTVLKEYYAIKKREWKTILESGGNQDIINEGIGSSIGDFFKSIIEAIKSMFNALFGKMKDKEASSKSADAEIEKNAKEIKTAIDSGVDPKAAALEKKKKAAEDAAEAKKIALQNAKDAKDAEAREKLEQEYIEVTKKAKAISDEIKEEQAAFEAVHGKELDIKEQFYVVDMYLKDYMTIMRPLSTYADDHAVRKDKETVDAECNKLAFEMYNSFFKPSNYNTFTEADMANPSSYFKAKYAIKAPSEPIYAKDLASNTTIYTKMIAFHNDAGHSINKHKDDVKTLNDLLEKNAKTNDGKFVLYSEDARNMVNYKIHQMMLLAKQLSGVYVQCAISGIKNRDRNQQMVLKIQRRLLGKGESSDNNADNVSESCIIHGEVIDSDSIFDNGDGDFCNTEWIDLALKEAMYGREATKQRYSSLLLASDVYHSNRSTSYFGESVGNRDMLTEGVLSSIGEFISNLFNGIIEFIKDLFSKNEGTATRIEDKKKNADDLSKKLATSPTPDAVTPSTHAPSSSENNTPAPAPEPIKGFRNMPTCVISNSSDVLIKIEGMIKLMHDMEDIIDKLRNNEKDAVEKAIDSYEDDYMNRLFPVEIKNEVMKINGDNPDMDNLKYPDTNRVAQILFDLRQQEFITIKDTKAIIDKTSISDIAKSLKHSKDLHNELDKQRKRLIPKIDALKDTDISTDNVEADEDPRYHQYTAAEMLKTIKIELSGLMKMVTSVEGATYNCIRVYENMLTRYNKLLSGKPDSRDLNESGRISRGTINLSALSESDDFSNMDLFDLALKEAYKMEKRKEEIDAQRYLNECIMLASDITRREKISAIRSLTEAEAKQSKNLITRAIEGIKRIFQKFLEKLRSIGKDNTKYLLKYKKVILETKPMAQKIKMKDCFTGIKRLVDGKIGKFDYDAIKASLETPEAAQEWLKKQIPTVNDDVLNNIKEFRTWCLAYFCVAPESPLKEFEMSNPADVNMTDVYNFMFDIKKIETQLSTDQKALEDTAISFANAADKISKETAAATTAPVQPVQASAAWSVVYGKVLTERVIHEFEVVNDTKADANTTDPSRASSNMANSTEDAPDAEKTLRAGTAAGNNAELQKVKLHTDNYMAAIRVFFTAKLTATEIIQSELMKLIRLHVQNFVKDETQGTTGKATGTKYGDGAQPAAAK